MSVTVPAGHAANRESLLVAHVAALVDQELDAGWCSGPILNFVSTFLIFGVSSPQVSLEKVEDFSFFSRGKL